jgi:Tol biopolymer transport system component
MVLDYRTRATPGRAGFVSALRSNTCRLGSIYAPSSWRHERSYFSEVPLCFRRPHAERISEVALSPDGSRVAYVVEGKITVISSAGENSHAIAVENVLALRDVAWSADGKRIAFLADLPGEVPSAQVWTAAADGSGPVKHAELKGYAQAPRFSPDDRNLPSYSSRACRASLGRCNRWTRLGGVIDEKVLERRIATINLSSDRLTQVSPADMYVYEYDWTPDGEARAATAAHGPGDANWWIARLYRVKSQTGEMHEIYKPKLQLANPCVSPEGKHVAFIEGLISDEGSTGGDIYAVPIVGGASRNLTPNIKSSPLALAWTTPDGITFAENLDGNSGFGSVSIKGGAIQKLWTGEEVAYPNEAWTMTSSLANDTRSAHCTCRPSWWSIPTRAICLSSLPIHEIMRCALCNGSGSGSRKQSKFVPRLVRLPLDLGACEIYIPCIEILSCTCPRRGHMTELTE